MELTKADVQFDIDGKPVKFSIIHNLPETFGLSFSDALANWMMRTDDYTTISLCNYIDSKNTSYITMTEDEYNEINEETIL